MSSLLLGESVEFLVLPPRVAFCAILILTYIFLLEALLFSLLEMLLIVNFGCDVLSIEE